MSFVRHGSGAHDGFARRRESGAQRHDAPVLDGGRAYHSFAGIHDLAGKQMDRVGARYAGCAWTWAAYFQPSLRFNSESKLEHVHADRVRCLSILYIQLFW